MSVRRYRISDTARADIVAILSLSQRQFGDQARQRYQALILAAFQGIAEVPHRVGSQDRSELAPGVRSYHLNFSRQQAKLPQGTVKKPRHLVLYRVASDEVVEIIRLLHDAMELHLHLPDD